MSFSWFGIFCIRTEYPGFFSYFIQSRVFYTSLPYGSYFSPTQNLGSLLGLSQVSVFSQAPLHCAGLQLVTQFIHLTKDYYLQLPLNQHPSKIRTTQQLDYRCILPHPVIFIQNTRKYRLELGHYDGIKLLKEKRKRLKQNVSNSYDYSGINTL